MNNLDILARNRVQHLVSVVAAAAGAQPGNLADDGTASFSWNGGEGTLVFEHPPQDEDFIAHLDVAPLPGANLEVFLANLLGWNWAEHELHGAYFAVDPNSSRVLLCHWFAADSSPEWFSERMRHFFSLAHAFREKLSSVAAAPPQAPEPPRRDLRILDHV